MNDLLVHLALLVVISVAIVTLGVFFTHPEDDEAFKRLPRRLGVFLLGCAAVAAVMTLIGYTTASLG